MMVVGDGWVVVEGLHLDPTVLASVEWSAGGAPAGTGAGPAAAAKLIQREFQRSQPFAGVNLR